MQCLRIEYRERTVLSTPGLREATRAEDQGNLLNGGVSMNIVPSISENDSALFNSLSVYTTENFVQNSVGNFELGIGDLHGAMYISDVKGRACTNLICNKRMINVGQKWSVGRLGNRSIDARAAA